MSSTRLKNQRGEYRLQQIVNHNILNNRTNSIKRISNLDAHPQVGINVSHMPNTVLSENAVDIETNLFGIGSSDLVNNRPHITPRLRKLPDVYYYKPTEIFIPEPLVIENDQRPVI